MPSNPQIDVKITTAEIVNNDLMAKNAKGSEPVNWKRADTQFSVKVGWTKGPIGKNRSMRYFWQHGCFGFVQHPSMFVLKHLLTVIWSILLLGTVWIKFHEINLLSLVTTIKCIKNSQIQFRNTIPLGLVSSVGKLKPDKSTFLME